MGKRSKQTVTRANESLNASQWLMALVLIVAFSGLTPLRLSAQATRPAPSAAPAPSATELSNERWIEHSVGLSLRPPLGSKLFERPADNALLRIVGETEYVIKVSIRRLDNPDVDVLARQAIDQVGFKQPDAVQLSGKTPVKVGDRPMRVVYFKIPNRIKSGGANARLTKGETNNWVLGQAFLEGDPTCFVMIELSCQVESFAHDKAVFEAVINSIQMEDPAKLEKRRQDAAQRGDQLRKRLNINTIRASAPNEQWYIIKQDRRDIGWIHLTPRLDMQGMNQPGVQVDVEAQMESGGQSIRTVSQFFLSNDDKVELWSIKVNVLTPNLANAPPPLPRNPKAKPEDMGPKEPPAAMMAGDGSYTETGVRVGSTITINRRMPTGAKVEVQYDRPAATKDGQPRPYLSQVEIQLIDYLIPRTAPAELGFYAYHPATGKIAFRTERVETGPAGTRVISRATPEGAEQISIFDNRGPLIQRQLPDGQTIVPSTLTEVRSRWPEMK